MPGTVGNRGLISCLTRSLLQISLRNLRKLDCYANRRPPRLKTLQSHFFHLNRKYGSTAATSIMISAIG